MISTSNRKKLGPRNHVQRKNRRDKVYQLYFEKGVTAVKIAKELGVNVNTVNTDVSYLLKKYAETQSYTSLNENFAKQIEMLEIQRGRLSSFLEKAEIEKYGIAEILKLEKTITDITTKIGEIYAKLLSKRNNKIQIPKKQFVSVIRDICLKDNEEFFSIMDEKTIKKAIFLETRKNEEFVNEFFNMMQSEGLSHYKDGKTGIFYQILEFVLNAKIITNDEYAQIVRKIRLESIKEEIAEQKDEQIEAKFNLKYGSDKSVWQTEVIEQYLDELDYD